MKLSFVPLCFGSVMLPLLAGCSSNDPYPQMPPVAAVGRKANCDQCEKEIALVEQDQLFDFQGVQYTVCNSECAEKLKEKIVHGGEHSPEESD